MRLSLSRRVDDCQTLLLLNFNDNNLGGLKIPVLYGVTIGHTNDQLTLPLGVMATLNADAGTLEITENGVS
jgi:muramoyltetrapeptide carboxypeptidase LdcA involved in peptidoglycan recycling